VNFRTTIVLALVALTVCAVGCFTAGHQTANEPSYQNRRLSEWLRDFDNYNLTPEQHATAADAMRQIGSPAVPFLLERLSEARSKQSKIEMQKWRERRATAVFAVDPPANPRRESLAALDALGSAAVDALPTLKKLLQDDPPDSQALYVAARIGPAGVPLLTKFLNSTNKLLRLQAQTCLDMMNSHSEVLYPKIPVGPDAPSFDRRICEFNLKIMHAAFEEFEAAHPEGFPPQINIDSTPPPVLPK
jgi:hypothetical protein